VEQVNADAAKYIDSLTAEFKSRVAESSGEANTDLTVSYEVVTDNEDWLTLRLYTEWVEASGAQYSRYYNIDKKQDKVVQLSDLFAEDSDALSRISEDIKTQMREQMAADNSVSYFLDSDIPEDDFQQVKEDQNFRFDEKGNLVVCFDEYEVAPGSMGLVEFTVERSVFEDALAAR
jgi:quinol monooxygenase YgiN